MSLREERDRAVSSPAEMKQRMMSTKKALRQTRTSERLILGTPVGTGYKVGMEGMVRTGVGSQHVLWSLL